jgi:hypothetical protein
MTYSVKEYLRLEEEHKDHKPEECRFCRNVMEPLRHGTLRK